MSRKGFSTRIGIILAAVGSAVGLGNIWRFPYELGENGGGAFLLVYIIAIIVLGFPALMAEFIVGRSAKRNAVDSFVELEPTKKWYAVGIMGVLAAFLILVFYSVISGWTFFYFFETITGNLADKTPEVYESIFHDLSSSAFVPLTFLLIVMSVSHIIVRKGINSGIEKVSKILMPILFLILVILAINSLFLDKASEGLKFLFSFDFSKLTLSAILSAIGQAFFTLSIGSACMITYASYFKDNVNLAKTGTYIIILDTLVALLAGIIIFPAVFTFGLEPSAGEGLVFIALPNVFNQMFGGQLLAAMFYLLLSIAAITSLMSQHEAVTAFIHERFKIARKKASLYVALASISLSVIASLSFGLLSDFTIFGYTFFEIVVDLTATILSPLGGMFMCIFVGWFMNKKLVQKEVFKSGSANIYFFKTLIFLLKYITPTIIFIIFISSFIEL